MPGFQRPFKANLGNSVRPCLKTKSWSFALFCLFVCLFLKRALTGEFYVKRHKLESFGKKEAHLKGTPVSHFFLTDGVRLAMATAALVCGPGCWKKAG